MVVSDINGFIINRIQFAVLREALYIVESGAATAEDIDKVMKYGLGLRYAALGPFGVADFGGLDTFDHISSYLFADLEPPAKRQRTAARAGGAGKSGREKRRRFYDYSGGRAAEATRQQDALYIELAKTLYFGKEERDESDLMKSGPERIPHRALFRALGLTEEELERPHDRRCKFPE